MNIWSKNLQELHRVEEIFYKRLVRVKSAFSDVLVCPNCSKYSFVSELSRSTRHDAQIEFLLFPRCSVQRLKGSFKYLGFHRDTPVTSSKKGHKKLCRVSFFLSPLQKHYLLPYRTRTNSLQSFCGYLQKLLQGNLNNYKPISISNNRLL